MEVIGLNCFSENFIIMTLNVATVVPPIACCGKCRLLVTHISPTYNYRVCAHVCFSILLALLAGKAAHMERDL